jgi:hypothetical protein
MTKESEVAVAMNEIETKLNLIHNKIELVDSKRFPDDPSSHFQSLLNQVRVYSRLVEDKDKQIFDLHTRMIERGRLRGRLSFVSFLSVSIPENYYTGVFEAQSNNVYSSTLDKTGRYISALTKYLSQTLHLSSRLQRKLIRAKMMLQNCWENDDAHKDELNHLGEAIEERDAQFSELCLIHFNRESHERIYFFCRDLVHAVVCDTLDHILQKTFTRLKTVQSNNHLFNWSRAPPSVMNLLK